MGKLSFYACIREGSSGQLTITIPKKYRGIVTKNKIIIVMISDRKNDISKGEKVEYD